MVLGRTRGVACGHVFAKSGQVPQGIVIPISGELAAIKSDAGGRELCYAFFQAGDCAGAPCVLDHQPLQSDLRAIRGGEFFLMGCSEFRRFIDERPAVRERVLAAIGGLFRRSLEERDRIVFLPVGARLARFLLERACLRQSDGARLLLRETHAEIAVRLGSVREVVARAMAEFAERGLVRRTRHALFIVDWAGLVAEAGWGDGEPALFSCEAAPAAIRTRRFVLRALEGGPDEVAAELRCCHEHLADLALCRARGCALADADAASPGARAANPPSSRAHLESAPHAHDGRAHRQHRGRARHENAHTARHSPLHCEHDESPERTGRDERIIERRIELYRARAASIESKFGEDAPVPPKTSLFRKPDLAET